MNRINTIITTIVLLASILFLSCNNDVPQIENVDFRQEMRDFVIRISQNSKSQNPNFVVIPQNGIALISNNGEAEGELNQEYLDAIDAHGQEDLFYGYDADNAATPEDETNYIRAYLDRSKEHSNPILVTDYCFAPTYIDDSYSVNSSADYISFAAIERELNEIPIYPLVLPYENDEIIETMDQVQNFLYLINPGKFESKDAFIDAVTNTNYDLLIMDLFFDGDIEFTAQEINQLKLKSNGGTRLVVAYMSIGEAEDYRYYWNKDWSPKTKDWIDNENKNWAGNYKVRYWSPDWQEVIFGTPDSYLQKIVDAEFDGTYLDIISGYEYYEGL